MLVRDSTAADVGSLQEIYGWHVLNGLASFEETAPSVEEMLRRRADVLERNLPHLVAEDEGRIVGFAYAAPYRARSAYRFSVEDSVYVHRDFAGRGIGRTLLAELISRCRQLGLHRMIAVIGDSRNAASIGVHAVLGFRVVGVLEDVGFKHGRWVDTVLMPLPLD